MYIIISYLPSGSMWFCLGRRPPASRHPCAKSPRNRRLKTGLRLDAHVPPSPLPPPGCRKTKWRTPKWRHVARTAGKRSAAWWRWLTTKGLASQIWVGGGVGVGWVCLRDEEEGWISSWFPFLRPEARSAALQLSHMHLYTGCETC